MTCNGKKTETATQNPRCTPDNGPGFTSLIFVVICSTLDALLNVPGILSTRLTLTDSERSAVTFTGLVVPLGDTTDTFIRMGTCCGQH
mmetsp:Transcript_121966/g.327603  ORF Transcript_121966/g.327603 Transcript_121966/m.327603 type:complete len:88 (-) Transcript_121966:39-302(-)